MIDDIILDFYGNLRISEKLMKTRLKDKIKAVILRIFWWCR